MIVDVLIPEPPPRQVRLTMDNSELAGLRTAVRFAQVSAGRADHLLIGAMAEEFLKVLPQSA